jgi:hypothetical protein
VTYSIDINQGVAKAKDILAKCDTEQSKESRSVNSKLGGLFVPLNALFLMPIKSA